jgi:hypothetical protein
MGIRAAAACWRTEILRPSLKLPRMTPASFMIGGPMLSTPLSPSRSVGREV